jgi:hypothetical protein
MTLSQEATGNAYTNVMQGEGFLSFLKILSSQKGGGGVERGTILRFW